MTMVTQDDPRVIAAIQIKRQEPALGVATIARRVGLNKSVVYRIFRKVGMGYRTYTRPEALDRSSVLAFLEARSHDEPTPGYMQTRLYIGGVEPSETQMRRYLAWRNDFSCEPNFWGLDHFLTGPPNLGHVEEFFDFCEREGLAPWKNGKPDWSPT